MSEDKSIKLFTAAKELNIGTGTIVDFLATKGYKVQKHPMAQLDGDMYNTLLKEFAVDKIIKEEAKQISIGKIRKEDTVQFPEKPIEHRRSRDFENEEILIKNAGHHFAPPVAAEKPKPVEPQHEKVEDHNEVLPGVKVVGKIDLDNLHAKPLPVEKPVEKKVEVIIKQEVPPQQPLPEVPKEIVHEAPAAEIKKEIVPPVVATIAPAIAPPVVEPEKVAETPVVEAPEEPQEPEVIRAKAERLTGPNVVGKIQLPVNPPKRNPVASSSNTNNAADHKRKRKRKDHQGPGGHNPQQGQSGRKSCRSAGSKSTRTAAAAWREPSRFQEQGRQSSTSGRRLPPGRRQQA